MGISIFINVIQGLVIIILIFIIAFLLRNKRREKIINYNQRMIDREKFSKELNKDKEFYNAEIKNAKTIRDFARIHNNIMFNDNADRD
jgi:flagellar biosynthesis/type III secretory pathway M-ring protein FliF/YscJ